MSTPSKVTKRVVWRQNIINMHLFPGYQLKVVSNTLTWFQPNRVMQKGQQQSNQSQFLLFRTSNIFQQKAIKRSIPCSVNKGWESQSQLDYPDPICQRRIDDLIIITVNSNVVDLVRLLDMKWTYGSRDGCQVSQITIQLNTYHTILNVTL